MSRNSTSTTWTVIQHRRDTAATPPPISGCPHSLQRLIDAIRDRLPSSRRARRTPTAYLSTFAVITQMVIPYLHAWQIDRAAATRAAISEISGAALFSSGEHAPQHPTHDPKTCALCRGLQQSRYSVLPPPVVAARIADNRELQAPVSPSTVWTSHVDTPSAPRAPPALT